jgi:hypothetical protein
MSDKLPVKADSLTLREKEISREKYYQYISHNIDDYTDISFEPEEAAKISAYLKKVSIGSSMMVPMLCNGLKCPFATRCHFVAMNKIPLNRQCLIETELAKEWTIRYLEEYEVDPSNFTEVGYCNELAEIEVLQFRLNMSLAKPEHCELITDQVVGVTKDGAPIIQKQVSPFLEQKQVLTRRKSQIIKLMVGDRQEKYKKDAALKKSVEDDASSKMAQARKHLETLQRGLNKASANPSPSPTINKLQHVLTPDDIINSSEE